MVTTNDVRAVFLNFFDKRDHTVVASSPLVPQNDPTLMFTNAGMVQFKNVFTGLEQRAYQRAVSSQKCVRAGGKHNDLENVGYTARHQTFFEMLGNFSFGDYFKDHAIEMAWHLVTKELGINPSKLLVTVYSEDEEAARLWQKIAGLNDARIIRISTSDNFWQMGDTGPCGPCSEIFYDHGPSVAGGPPGSPEEDGDRFIEIWNLVFMQYEQLENGQRHNLPKPSIDTGMGLERITAVLQGKSTNYAIDLLRGIIENIAGLTGQDPDGENAASHKIIADHLRSVAFLIADGVLPANEGRGYVVRRIMRRAMRHAHILGAKEPLMYRLVPDLVRRMGGHFSELKRAEPLIADTLKSEETRFQQTLERGLRLLESETSKLGAGQQLAGTVAFSLYDTYGFPPDLTQDILRSQGRTLDMAGFDNAMNAQRTRARQSWVGSGDAKTDKIWFDIRDKNGPTSFMGYETEVANATVVALIHNSIEVQEVKTGDKVTVITNQTPFYGESGGQQGDQGVMRTQNGAEIRVEDTQKKVDGLHLHRGVVVSGSLAVDDTVMLEIDGKRRAGLRANHSVTHLMHAALRRVLGGHVVQRGSQVSPESMRFDFAHQKPISNQERQQIENEVNLQIRLNASVVTRLMTPKDAIEAGALALFGEKYGDEVRVVSMGKNLSEGNDLSPRLSFYSTELCGGTHVRQTGDIGYFKIISEGAVASGVRRVEVLTGQAAQDYVVQCENHLADMAAALKTTAADVPQRVASLLAEKRTLQRVISAMRQKLADGGQSNQTDVDQKMVANTAFIAKSLHDMPPQELKPLVDRLKNKIGTGVVAVVGINGAKASIVVGVTDNIMEKFDAVALVKAAAIAMGGKGGGGRPDMAQAGGSDIEKVADAFRAIEARMQESQ